MHLSKCKFCGVVFPTRKVEIVCKNCKEIDENLFSRIEDYLRRFPNSNAMQIADGCQISVLEVLQYIDEGRLQLSFVYILQYIDEGRLQLSKGEFKRL